MPLGSPGFYGSITVNFREKVDTLSLQNSPFLSLFPSPKTGWESLGQDDLSSHATCQATIGWRGFPYPLIPLLCDFHQMESCHVSTHGPHLSSCLTNSAHDTWHLLSHSKCAKYRCLEKREIPTVSEFDVVARFRETIPTVKSISSFEI